MKGKRNKIFGVMMALVLAVSLASVGVVSTAAADPGSLKWSEITIPEEGADGDYALWPGSDIGPIAVSPAGGTIFAASGESLSQLMRSTDGGYTWKAVMTKLDGDDVDVDMPSDFGDEIVAIAVSPDYDGDGTLIVATADDVYYSEDEGDTFDSMTFDGDGDITSVDLGTDADGNLDAFLVGAGDVYLKEGLIGGWAAQDANVDNVLDVAFSVNYAVDGQIIAAVGDPVGVKAKFSKSEWSATALLRNEDAETFSADSASIGLPDNYDAYSSIVFIGVSAGGEGDVYMVEYVGGASGDWFAASDWETSDLNVRGTVGTKPTETDIWSIAVSGDAILAGTMEFNREPDEGNIQYLVYASIDSGATWAASDKQPTGTEMAVVVLGSDYAYVGTYGDESAFSAAAGPVAEPRTTSQLSSWNQLSLIDTVIDEIIEMMPSLTYALDNTLYIATSGADTTSLWVTMDDGLMWEREYCSTLTNMGEVDPGENICAFDIIRLTIAGDIIVAEKMSKEMRMSSDSGISWGRRIAPEGITALSVVSMSTFYIGDAAGNVHETTDGGFADWTKATGAIQGAVIQIAIGPDGAILVGNSGGTVYICYDRALDFEFERVGPGAAGSLITLVAFDSEYDINDTIYAACTGSSAVYRFVIGESTTWTEIDDNIAVSGLMVATDGTLYVSDATPDAGVARSVNPTSDDPSPGFDMVTDGLAAGATLEMFRVIPGGSNILFAVDTANGELLTFTDTLTGKLSLVIPADGAVSGVILEAQALARVVLAWEGIAEADAYQYQVAIDEDFKTTVALGSALGEVAVEELYLGVTYYWKARVTEPIPSQWSETQSFTTPLGPGGARPITHEPEFGETDVDLQPVLQWSGLASATNYELQVAEEGEWTNLVVDKTGDAALGAVTAYAITTDLKLDTTYYWRVRATSVAGSESPWSDTSAFTTVAEVVEPGAEATPVWVWVVIAIAAVLLIAVIVLIVRTRRAT